MFFYVYLNLRFTLLRCALCTDTLRVYNLKRNLEWFIIIMIVIIDFGKVFESKDVLLTGSSTSTHVVIQTSFLMVVLDFKPSSAPFMIQKRSCSLGTKVNQHFNDMIKIRLIMINNLNIFTICESLI